MKKIKFGILVPNFNGATFIVNTLSQLKKGFPGLEIVVVDDASTDNSLEVLSALNIKVLNRKKNGGYAAAVNTGLKYFQSKKYNYVLIANVDIKLKKIDCSKIFNALHNFMTKPKVGVLGFVENNFDVKFNEDIPGFLFVLNLQVLNEIGYLDESFHIYGEEQDFFIRAQKANFSIIQTGIHISHIGESQSIRIRNSWLAIRNSIYLEIKNYSILKVLRKFFVLFLIINRLYNPVNIDYSLERVRRPGILIGNVLLIAACIWNIFNYVFILVSNVKSKFR